MQSDQNSVDTPTLLLLGEMHRLEPQTMIRMSVILYIIVHYIGLTLQSYTFKFEDERMATLMGCHDSGIASTNVDGDGYVYVPNHA